MTDFDREVFQRFVPTDHPLVIALRKIDWEGLRPVVEAFYCRNRGQPAIDPIRMLKLEFLRYWNNLSDRQVLQRTETDVAFRCFLQVGHAFRLPDFSSLSYFRGRLGEQGFAAVFDQLIAQARQLGLVRDRLRLKDASHVVAGIAVPTTLHLVAQIRDRLLNAIEPFDSEWVSGQRIEVDLLRDRTQEQAAELRLEGRVTHLRELVAWAETLPPPAADETHPATDSAWQHFQQTLALAQKILQDRQPNAERKTLSVHDPEARRGKHGEYYDGYLTDILMDADSGLITQINVLEAGGDEARDAVDLVRAEQNAHAGESVTCPAGKTSTSRRYDAKRHATTFRFRRATCEACPLNAQCLAHSGPVSQGRTVTKNEYDAEHARVRQRAETAEFAAVRREHPAVERKLNELMNHHRGRRARYWGRAKVRVQELMTACVVNTKRLLTWLAVPRRAEPTVRTAMAT